MNQNKKIVIASDSFKGSLCSAQVAQAIERGIKSASTEYLIHKVVIADGGEGTTEALINGLNGHFKTIVVKDPLLRCKEAKYGISSDGHTAVIELASASGMALLSKEELNPMETTTYGMGEMIVDAYESGCRNFLLGLGGSATNDAGVGMLSALGFRFLDSNGTALQYGAKILSRIASIEYGDYTKQLIESSTFTAACDVTNPFAGSNGAAYVFAPQKGATPQMVRELDAGLRHFAQIVKQFNGNDIMSIEGAGAAGGVAGAVKTLLNAELKSGIGMVLDTIDFDNLIKDCVFVITGEGQLDKQTLSGKAPLGVLRRAQKYNIPVIAIGGSVKDSELLNKEGFAAIFSIQSSVVTLEEALNEEVASKNIERTVSQIINLLNISKK